MTKPTQQQINSAQAGREIDAWVAEFVMGWGPIKLETYGYDKIPDYSTSWSAMREIVERMDKLGFIVALDNYNVWWRVVMVKLVNGLEISNVALHDSRLSLAVSKAALLTRLED